MPSCSGPEVIISHYTWRSQIGKEITVAHADNPDTTLTLITGATGFIPDRYGVHAQLKVGTCLRISRRGAGKTWWLLGTEVGVARYSNQTATAPCPPPSS
jgi:hypothetical protein